MGKPSKQTLGDRIRQRLKALGKDASSVSRAAGFSEDLIRNVYKQERTGKAPTLRANALHSLARELDTTPIWLLTGEGAEDIDEPPDVFDKPKIAEFRPSIPGAMAFIDAYAGAGGGGLSEDKVRGEIAIPESARRSLTSADPGRIHWIEVRGNSMFPTLWQGDLVAINVADNGLSEGGLYAVQEIDTAEIVVKRLDFVEADKSSIWIISDNPNHSKRRETKETVRIIGRVVGKIGRVV